MGLISPGGHADGRREIAPSAVSYNVLSQTGLGMLGTSVEEEVGIGTCEWSDMLGFLVQVQQFPEPVALTSEAEPEAFNDVVKDASVNALTGKPAEAPAAAAKAGKGKLPILPELHIFWG